MAYHTGQPAQAIGTGAAGAGRAAPAAAPRRQDARPAIHAAAAHPHRRPRLALAAVCLHAGDAADRLGHAVGGWLPAAADRRHAAAAAARPEPVALCFPALAAHAGG
ncbi:conserved hypothetical protein [Ricinus communis]|uniref:Uncharacterized protein n=1 Tax=Ricinus communis TaxID=3988 RepID=B9T9U5_RICCO|nr:conserved hypothetical protein [Ricinus communis]